MTIYFAEGSDSTDMSDECLRQALHTALDAIGERHKVLILPPDFTRYHSRAGLITQMAHERLGAAVADIMPALGTHTPVTDAQRQKMFGPVPADLFRVHDWRNDVVTLGEVPREMVLEASGGHLDRPWPAQVNRLVAHGGHDLVLSIGQVVPHEVMGMANYNKNVLIGTGGKDAIDYSHFVGAAYGMERMMGKADNPLRRILNYAADKFLAALPIVYVLTVVGPRGKPGDGGGGSGGSGGGTASGGTDPGLALRGLFIGDDVRCFDMAAQLAARVNFTLVPRPLEKVVARMDEHEFSTTWLANKAVYRTRMAIADGGELVVLAPGVKRFGEDPKIDAIIRTYGYRSTPEIMAFLKDSLELSSNLSAAAHLIHGSSEGRFKITYCLPPGGLTREEVEGVGFAYARLEDVTQRYNPAQLQEGWNTVAGEEVYYISNPALGLWAEEGRLLQS